MTTIIRNPNWSIPEDEALCNAWVQISEDGSIGICQTSAVFWERVKVIFSAKGFGTPRTIIGLRSRWRVINAQCGSWNAALRKANSTPTSGSNLSDVVSSIFITFFKLMLYLLIFKIHLLV
ncbi:hypothetical protein LINGRAHAP2_LOCUS23553 [Linum grandiflorum]